MEYTISNGWDWLSWVTGDTTMNALTLDNLRNAGINAKYWESADKSKKRIYIEGIALEFCTYKTGNISSSGFSFFDIGLNGGSNKKTSGLKWDNIGNKFYIDILNASIHDTINHNEYTVDQLIEKLSLGFEEIANELKSKLFPVPPQEMKVENKIKNHTVLCRGRDPRKVVYRPYDNAKNDGRFAVAHVETNLNELNGLSLFLAENITNAHHFSNEKLTIINDNYTQYDAIKEKFSEDRAQKLLKVYGAEEIMGPTITERFVFAPLDVGETGAQYWQYIAEGIKKMGTTRVKLNDKIFVI